MTGILNSTYKLYRQSVLLLISTDPLSALIENPLKRLLYFRPVSFMTECVSILSLKTCRAQKKLSAPHKYKSAQVHETETFDCEIFVKKVPRPKHCKAKPSIQRIQDLHAGIYTRSMGRKREICNLYFMQNKYEMQIIPRSIGFMNDIIFFNFFLN